MKNSFKSIKEPVKKTKINLFMSKMQKKIFQREQYYEDKKIIDITLKKILKKDVKKEVETKPYSEIEKIVDKSNSIQLRRDDLNNPEKYWFSKKFSEISDKKKEYENKKEAINNKIDLAIKNGKLKKISENKNFIENIQDQDKNTDGIFWFSLKTENEKRKQNNIENFIKYRHNSKTVTKSAEKVMAENLKKNNKKIIINKEEKTINNTECLTWKKNMKITHEKKLNDVINSEIKNRNEILLFEYYHFKNMENSKTKKFCIITDIIKNNAEKNEKNILLIVKNEGDERLLMNYQENKSFEKLYSRIKNEIKTYIETINNTIENNNNEISDFNNREWKSRMTILKSENYKFNNYLYRYKKISRKL